MASREALGVFLLSISRRSYYDILRVPRDAEPDAIKSAFHDFSLLYHPDQYVASPDVVDVATEIYKRGVEAYRCLSRPPLRARYDRGLVRGKLRFEPSKPSTVPPPPPPLRTLEAIARSRAGKGHAIKADRYIDTGQLEKARLQLVSACQCEPDNEELAERLRILYEALALESL
jgi:curved DNA-binding protein CbpA